MFHAFDQFRLLDGVQFIALQVHGAIVAVIIGFLSDFEDTTELSTSKVLVEHIKVPFELSRTFITRRNRLGVPDTSALL